MMTVRVLFSLVVFSISLSASAATPIVRPDTDVNLGLQKKALTIPEKLLSRRIGKIGDLSLSEVAKEIKALHWRVVEGVFFAGSGGRRASAVFLTESKTIFINDLSWRQTSGEIKPILLLHETLGAMGFNDEEYQLSLSLWLLSRDARISLSKDKTPWLSLFENLDRSSRTPKYIQLAGGVTGVGGGGDEFELTLKAGLLKRIEQLFQRAPQLDRKLLEQSRELILNARVIVDYVSVSSDTSVFISRGTLTIRFSPLQLVTPERSSRLIDSILTALGGLR